MRNGLGCFEKSHRNFDKKKHNLYRCSCEESTCDFTERVLSQKSKNEIEKCKIGDLSPMISIQKLELSHRHVEKRYDYADILLGGFADTSTKLEFSIFR